MLAFSIGVSVAAYLPPGGALTRDAFPTLSRAVQGIAEHAHRIWQGYAAGAPLPDGKTISRRSGKYATSILLRQTGDFSAEIYSSLPYAEAIERGTPQTDMKTMLGSSLKVRLTKDGRRYLIIPFRHDTPGSVQGNPMPKAVHGWWQGGRTPSAILAQTSRISGTGAYDIKTRQLLTVPAWKYEWGDRLDKGTLAALGVSEAKAKRLAGMVNFRRPGGKGGGAHSQYITFRTMMEGSSGWIRPAQEGKWPARTTAEQIQPAAEEAFRAAMKADIAGWLRADG